MIEQIAKIHSLESAKTNAGPGIRYVVSMAGCPLRCKYCNAPDSWDAVQGTEKTIPFIVNEALKYKTFMDFSDGGVTISGGEPLLYPVFLRELLKALKEEEIHTAIITSGFCDITPELDAMLYYTDLVILDIKHIDTVRHFEMTKQYNEKIFDFMKHLELGDKRTWIRYPVIPNYNDSIKYAESFATIVERFLNVELVEIVPFSPDGKYKWEKLGLKYAFEDKGVTPKNKIKEITSVLHEHGLVTVGDID